MYNLTIYFFSRRRLQSSQLQLDTLNDDLENTTQRVYDSNMALQDLRSRAQHLQTDSDNLKDNATVLQEANVEGILTCGSKIRR